MNQKEYIERGALIESLTVDFWEHYSGCHSSSEVSVFETMRDSVAEAPTADVVEVVRCKDCVCGRHPNKSDRFEALYPAEYLYCSVHESGVKKDGYCSYGERKEQT
jgi:hypothetical protein